MRIDKIHLGAEGSEGSGEVWGSKGPGEAGGLIAPGEVGTFERLPTCSRFELSNTTSSTTE